MTSKEDAPTTKATSLATPRPGSGPYPWPRSSRARYKGTRPGTSPKERVRPRPQWPGWKCDGQHPTRSTNTLVRPCVQTATPIKGIAELPHTPLASVLESMVRPDPDSSPRFGPESPRLAPTPPSFCSSALVRASFVSACGCMEYQRCHIALDHRFEGIRMFIVPMQSIDKSSAMQKGTKHPTNDPWGAGGEDCVDREDERTRPGPRHPRYCRWIR